MGAGAVKQDRDEQSTRWAAPVFTEPNEEVRKPVALFRSAEMRGTGGRSTESVRRAGPATTVCAGSDSVFSGGSDVNRRNCITRQMAHPN